MFDVHFLILSVQMGFHLFCLLKMGSSSLIDEVINLLNVAYVFFGQTFFGWRKFEGSCRLSASHIVEFSILEFFQIFKGVFVSNS